MTISSQTRTAGPYTGTGLVSTYGFAFKVFTKFDLLLQQVDTLGVTTVPVLDSDYTVTLNADQDNNPGGSVVLAVPLASGYSLTITTNVAATQSADLTNAGGFFPQVIEDALDKLTILFQQLGLVGLVQAVRVPEIGGIPALPSKAQRASKVLACDANGNVVCIVGVDASSAAALDLNLRDGTISTKGAGQVALAPTITYPKQSAGAFAERTLPLSQFTGADPTGAADTIAALASAVTREAALAVPKQIDGVFRIDSQWIPGRYFTTYGAGKTSDPTTAHRAPSVLVKNFNGTGVYLGWDDSALENVQVDNATGKTGDNVQLAGSRTSLRWVSSTNSGGVGIRVGTDSALGLDGFNANTNVWFLLGCISLSSASHAVFLNDPTGSGDANAGVMVGGDFRNAGGDGIRVDNSLYNTFVGPTVQNCAGPTVRLTANSRGTTFIGGDLEPGAGGIALIESGTFGNYIAGAFYGGVPAMWQNNARGALKGRNWLVQHNANLAKMALHDELNVYDPDTGGTPAVNFWSEGVGVEQQNARMQAIKSGASGGKWAVQTKRVGGSLTDAITADENQNVLIGGMLGSPLTSSVLTITANAITPTRRQHHVGAGLIKTINAPVSGGIAEFILIPDAATTWDATGNIATTAGTMTVGRPVLCAFDANLSKWYLQA